MLDVGCGDGVLTHYLAGLGHQAIGVDADPDILPADGPGAHFMLGDAHSLPFGYDSFDAVVSVMMLHHSRRPELALAEMRRVLKPGGLIVICGIGKSGTFADRWRSLADVFGSFFADLGKKHWETPAEKMHPRLSWDESRAVIEEILPGASWRRLPSWRYLACWQRD